MSFTQMNDAVKGLVSYLFAGVITLAVARTVVGGAFDLLLPLAVLAVGCVIPVALAHFDPHQVLRILFGIVLAATLCAICFDALPDRPYGDGVWVVDFLDRGYVFPRWLLGISLAVALYVGLWKFPPIAAHLPTQLATPGAFAALMCSTAMGISSIAILARWRTRAVMFAMLTPVWLLFSTGYVEYYPLMIGAWLAALAWTFERPIYERHALAVGCIVGLMPAIYIGFIGFSLILFVVYAISRPARALLTLGVAAASLAFAISTAYPSVSDYLQRLYAEMNFGNQHLSFLRYARHSAGPQSIFFTTTYAFSPSHLTDVSYMLFWSGGWLFLPTALVALVTMRNKGVRLASASRDARLWLGLALLAWQLYYLMYMIPLSGPTIDIDLFSPTFIVLAFAAGWLVEQSITSPSVRHAILCAIVGADVVTAVSLAWVGLPPRA